VILLNGLAARSIPASDRGISYGDGVFRTILVRGGVVQQQERQLAKLAADCARIGIIPPPRGIIETDVARTCSGVDECALKVIVTRGCGERGYRYAADAVPTRIILTSPLPKYAQTYASGGVKVCLCRLKLGVQPALAGIKHLNRLENVLARSEWSDPDIAEGLLCDATGNVIGGTMTNIFIGTRGHLATPQLERCGVAGVTRERIIEAAAEHGVPCSVTDLTWSDVLGADEIFLVNSLAGVWPVREIQGEVRVPGMLARAAQTWLTQDHGPQVA
jgi:4-amino-4-deoxychorismate lyase